MAHDDPAVGEVEFRAFRGSQRSSVYRSHVVAASALMRIVQIAAQEHLPLLGQLEVGQRLELEPGPARQLAQEVGRLRSRAVLLELDADLTGIAEVANWCARSREKAWLIVTRL